MVSQDGSDYKKSYLDHITLDQSHDLWLVIRRQPPVLMVWDEGGDLENKSGIAVFPSARALYPRGNVKVWQSVEAKGRVCSSGSPVETALN